jgi:hypothetical protein
MADINDKKVPRWLRNWFLVHFAIDFIFAVPLFLFPVEFLTLLGWEVVDPLASRLVAAALFGIGIESFLCRDSGIGTFKNMLNLKIIWSISAIIGITLSLIQVPRKEPLMGWLFALIFLLFNFLWVYWKIRLGKIGPGS